MLEHFGIGLSVQDQTVEQICRVWKVDTGLFLTLANLFNGHTSPLPVSETPETLLSIVAYLQKNHEYYLNEKLPVIHSLIQEMHHENDQSEMVLVEQFFHEYRNEVVEHLNYESQEVFPYIESLCAQTVRSVPNEYRYSMEEFKGHHSDIEEKLTDLKNLLVKYLPRRNDAQIRRNLLFGLFELEYDLNIHTRIEDSILIPLAEALEQRKALL